MIDLPSALHPLPLLVVVNALTFRPATRDLVQGVLEEFPGSAPADGFGEFDGYEEVVGVEAVPLGPSVLSGVEVDEASVSTRFNPSLFIAS